MLIRDFCVLHNIGRRDIYRIKDKLGLCFERNKDGYVDLTPSQCTLIKQEWELHKQTCNSRHFSPCYVHDTQAMVTLRDALSFLKDTGVQAILRFNGDYAINMLNKTEEQQEEIYSLYVKYTEAKSSHERRTILNKLDKILK